MGGREGAQIRFDGLGFISINLSCLGLARIVGIERGSGGGGAAQKSSRGVFFCITLG